MDIIKYKALLSILEKGSLSAAAEEFGYSPSGMTRMMDSMEKEIGFPILFRSAQGVKLTPEGEALLPSIRETLYWSDEINVRRDEILGLVTGTLYIGTYSSVAAAWLPKILAEYSRRYPNVTIHLKEESNQEILTDLTSHRLSCAFTSQPENYNGDWISLMEDRLLLQIPENHPLAKKEAIHPEELNDVPFINLLPHQNAEMDDLLKKYKVKPLTRITTISSYTAWCMVAAGLGVAINNELMVKEWSGPVVSRPFDPNETIILGIAIPSLKEASPAMKKLVELAKEMVGVM